MQDPYTDPTALAQQGYAAPVSQDELYANMMQQNNIKNLISQISPENQLYEIEMRIRGLRKNIMTGTWEKMNPNAKEVSEVLVERFMSYLSAILNQGTSLSNLSEIQVNKIMKLVIEWVVDDLNSNAEEYGLESNYTERTRIGHIIFNSVFFVLLRAVNGMENRRMWQSVNLTESASLDPNSQKKAGLMESLKFWK